MRTFLLFIVVPVLLIAGGLFLFVESVHLKDKNTLDRHYSHFVELAGKNEYVIAELKSTEFFNQSRERVLGVLGKDVVIGEASVSFSIPVYYKFYIHPEDMKYQLEDQTLKIQVKALYLQQPVAVDISKMEEGSSSAWFSPNREKLYTELKGSVTEKLVKAGNDVLPSVKPMAAKSLADNINRFMKQQGSEGFYNRISIEFLDETDTASPHVYDFDNSLCGDQACEIIVPLGDKLITVP